MSDIADPNILVGRISKLFLGIFDIDFLDVPPLTEDYDQPLKDRIPWTGTGDIIKQCFTENSRHRSVMASVCGDYLKARISGKTSNGADVFCINDAFSYSAKKFFSHMKDSVRKELLDLVVASHHLVLLTRKVCFRPEMAWIVCYADSFEPICPIRKEYMDVRNGLDDLRQMINSCPRSIWLEIFFGLRLPRDYKNQADLNSLRWMRNQHSGPWGVPGVDDLSCLDSDIMLPTRICAEDNDYRTAFNDMLEFWCAD